MADNEFRTVSLRDPAIDWAEAEREQGIDIMQRYWETRDLDLIKPYFIAGVEPQYFVLREVPDDIADNWVLGNDADEGDARVYRRAFRAALVRVENYRTIDGTIMALQPSKDASGVVRERELRRWGQPQRIEIGSVAIQRGFFPPGTEPTFRLPQRFLGLLFHPTHHSAVQKLLSRARSSAPASPAPESTTRDTTESEQPSSDSRSASPTAATAAGQSAAGG